jgi:hypothetical protein
MDWIFTPLRVDPTRNGPNSKRLSIGYRPSIIFTMAENQQFQSLQEGGSGHCLIRDLIRQDYHIQDFGGQRFVLPNAFQGIDLSLARIKQPNFSKAIEMPAGVSIT